MTARDGLQQRSSSRRRDARIARRCCTRHRSGAAPPSTIGRPAKRSPTTARSTSSPSDAQDDNQPPRRARPTTASPRRTTRRLRRRAQQGRRCYRFGRRRSSGRGVRGACASALTGLLEQAAVRGGASSKRQSTARVRRGCSGSPPGRRTDPRGDCFACRPTVIWGRQRGIARRIASGQTRSRSRTGLPGTRKHEGGSRPERAEAPARRLAGPRTSPARGPANAIGHTLGIHRQRARPPPPEPSI